MPRIEALTCVAYPTGRYDRATVPAMLAIKTIIEDPRQKPRHRLFLTETVDTSKGSIPLVEHLVDEPMTWNGAGTNAIMCDTGTLFVAQATFGIPLLLWNTDSRDLSNLTVFRRYADPEKVRHYVETAKPANDVLMLRTADIQFP